MSVMFDYPVMVVRPYQLFCIVCSLGEDETGPRNPRLRELLEEVRENPDMPVAVCCNSGDLFAYQNPGSEEDTPEGADYNLKRDYEILRRLDLVPGSVLPARVLFKRLLEEIPSSSGICGFETVVSEAWRGCSKAGEGYYEKGREKGIDAIIPPRAEEKMAPDKEETLQEMYRADAIRLRPHLLLCAVGQYGDGIRPPFKEDNLPDMIQHVLKHPDTPITLVCGADRMMCGPCPWRAVNVSACVTGTYASAGLYNVLKDLNTLHALGLTFGTTMKAKALFELVFERIPTVWDACALDPGIPERSLWRDQCGKLEAPCPGYDKGRKILMKEFAKTQ